VTKTIEEEKRIIEENRSQKKKKKNKKKFRLPRQSKSLPKWQIMGSVKIPLKLDLDQKKLLNFWFGGCRKIWNDCVNLTRAKTSFAINLTNLAHYFKTIPTNPEDDWKKDFLDENGKHYTHRNEWMNQIPYEIVSHVLSEFYTSFTVSMNQHSHRKMKYRKKKKQECISIISRLLIGGQICPKYWKWNGKELPPLQVTRRFQKQLPDIKSLKDPEFQATEKGLHGLKLIKTRLGKYFFCFARPRCKILNSESKRTCVAIDPGVRTFATCYDSENVMEWGIKRTVFEKVTKRLDRLHSKWRSLRTSIRETRKHLKQFNDTNLLKHKWIKEDVIHLKRIKRAMFRTQLRFENQRNQFHHLLSKFLVRNYRIILLPTYRTSEMVQKKKQITNELGVPTTKERKIGKKTVRNMLGWAFYKFSQILEHKAQIYGSDLYRVSERYSSKACGSCGMIKHELKDEKIYDCGLKIDRDFNASRNILLKYFYSFENLF